MAIKTNQDIDARQTSDSYRPGWARVWQADTTTTKGIVAGFRRRLGAALFPKIALFNYLLVQWLDQYLNLKNMRILEIGGTGSLGLLLAKRCRHYTLIDYSAPAVSIASQRLRQFANATVVHADMFDFLPTVPQDVVLSMGLLEHFFGAEREQVLKSHVRMSSQFICIGTPSDIPPNWWRHYRYELTKAYPSQRPVSESELFELTVSVGLQPVAMTRIDPTYGRRCNALKRLLFGWRSAIQGRRGWGIDSEDGGLVVFLASLRAR
ncbi:MAG: class I SAM-dependent methyltransferase [Verrucomicrobia bacterium]|nr:class I SAM-dependent methyltransferase [Verrucomicrobiota bacterium]